MYILINLLINGLAVYISAHVLPGVSVDTFFTAIIVSVILSIVNTFLKPVLFLLTLPATLLTLGLFAFALNALMVYLVTLFVPGFQVSGFWSALFFSVVLSLVSSVLRRITK